MKICFALIFVVSVMGAIPPTAIDAGIFSSYTGSIQIVFPWTSPKTTDVTYNTYFGSKPTFALLLSGFILSIPNRNAGYTITYGAITTSSASFTLFSG
jgi:hypothetical protein